MRALLSIFALIISSSVAAFPNNTSNCTNCHSTSIPGGSIAADPTSIDLGVGDTGVVTLNLSGIPDAAQIGLFGMNDAGLDATISTPDNWNDAVVGGANVLLSDVISSMATSYDLTFDVGPGATLGTYLIDVLFVGGDGPGAWADTASFDVRVVPIPAAVWLFGSGLLGLVGMARLRRHKT